MTALRCTILGFCILAAAALPCLGEDIPDKLTLADAIGIALRVNAGLKSAETSHTNAESSLRVAGFTTSTTAGGRTAVERVAGDGESYASVFGRLQYADPSGIEASADLTPLALGGDRALLGVTVRRPIMSGRGLLSEKGDALASARTSFAVSSNRLYRARQNTARNVIEAYYDAVRARDQVTVAERAASYAEQAAKDAAKRANEKLIAGIDVSRAEIRAAEKRVLVSLQKQRARAAIDQLLIAIGVGVGKTPELVDAIPEPPAESPDVDAAVQKALANRSELADYDLQIEEQRRRLAIRNDRLRPRLDLVASARSTNSDSGFVSPSLWSSGALSGGLELSFPLDKRVEEANRDVEARELATLSLLKALEEEQISNEVREACRLFESSRVSLEIYTNNLQVAEQSLYQANRRVEEGLDTNRDVLDAQESLANFQTEVLNAKIDLFLAGIRLKYAMGEDITKTGSQ